MMRLVSCVLTHVPLGATDAGINTNPTESCVGNWVPQGLCPSQLACCGKLLPFIILAMCPIEMFSTARDDAKRCLQVLSKGYVSNPAF